MKYTVSIKKNRVFKYVLKKGIYKQGKFIVVHITTARMPINYLGICVSKKNGNSVVRNKLKRWVREVYKYEETSLKKGYNIIVLYKKNVTIDMIDYNIVKEDITNCFEDLKLYEEFKE